MWYQYKENIPTDVLPQRIRLSDGTTRTNLRKLTLEQLNALGVHTVSEPPVYTDNQDLNWDESTKSWVVGVTTDPNKIAARWAELNADKNLITIKLAKRIGEYCKDGETLSVGFGQVPDKINAVTPENYSNPFVIDFTDISSIGITSALGIPVDQMSMIYQTTTELAQEKTLEQSFEQNFPILEDMVNNNI